SGLALKPAIQPRRSTMPNPTRLLVSAIFAMFLLAGCGSNRTSPLAPNGTVSSKANAVTAATIPTFPNDPSQVVSTITNPYLNFARGRTFTYAGTAPDGHETNTVEITNKTKTILGVATTAVHDQVFLEGSLIEDTIDWFAQDQAGNVWYFGEDSKELDHGVVTSTEGSWQAGVNGAVPGIAMLANPQVNAKYSQEFQAGVAEDMAKVLSLTKTVTVPYGTFNNCLETQEWTALEPGSRGYKFYAAGVGIVSETDNKGETSELISIQH